jgi:hypothetical protein
MSNHTQRDELSLGVRNILLGMHVSIPENGMSDSEKRWVEHYERRFSDVIDQYTQRLVLEGKIEEISDQITGYNRGIADKDEHAHIVFAPIIKALWRRKRELQSQLDKLNGDRES